MNDSDISSYEDAMSTLSADSDNGNETRTSARVFLRLRPVASPSVSFTIADAGRTLIAGHNAEKSGACTSNNKMKMEQHFSFSAIFDREVNQAEVYKKCIADEIDREKSFTVINYGTSGSGKTYTLFGEADSPGIVPRAIENLFGLNTSYINSKPAIKLENASVKILDDESLEREESLRQELLEASVKYNSKYECVHNNILAEHGFQTVEQGDVSVFIWISFVEIYNENVYDLLALPQLSQRIGPTMSTPPRQNLKILANDGKVFIKKLTSIYVKSSAEAIMLLYWGLQHATYAATSINGKSSRSHCIFIMNVLKYTGRKLITEISYKFCDLAGAERLNKTHHVSNRFTEATNINTSLLTLSKCLDAVHKIHKNKGKTQMVPIRDSKLTMFLQAPLLGKEKLTMVVNFMPTDDFYVQNMTVLRFTAIARSIIFKEPVREPEKIQQLIEAYNSLQIELKQERALHKDEKEQCEKKLAECETKSQMLHPHRINCANRATTTV